MLCIRRHLSAATYLQQSLQGLLRRLINQHYCISHDLCEYQVHGGEVEWGYNTLPSVKAERKETRYQYHTIEQLPVCIHKGKHDVRLCMRDKNCFCGQWRCRLIVFVTNTLHVPLALQRHCLTMYLMLAFLLLLEVKGKQNVYVCSSYWNATMYMAIHCNITMVTYCQHNVPWISTVPYIALLVLVVQVSSNVLNRHIWLDLPNDITIIALISLLKLCPSCMYHVIIYLIPFPSKLTTQSNFMKAIV